jgi:two-component system, NtrC family, response regulator AtoC
MCKKMCRRSWVYTWNRHKVTPEPWNEKCVKHVASMDFFFGRTEKMAELRSKAEPIARSYMPLLIEGETGTGKERLAQHFHDLRGGGCRLVKLSCDSWPSTDWGGFGGTATLEGSRDTVLLKRVHRLPMIAQERLLHWFDQCGGPAPFLISTTSDAVERLAAEQKLMPELLYRIAAYRIALPPLRERLQDTPHLFGLMLAELGQELGMTARKPDSRAVEALMNYSWPGNLRELRNLARVFLLAPDSLALEAEMVRRRHTIAWRRPGDGPALKEQVKQASKRVEGEIILRVLEQHRWNRRRAAEELRISYRSLMYKMKSCDIRNEQGARRSVAH